MPDAASIASELFEQVIGKGCPMQALLDSGAFPVGWPETYLELLQEAQGLWKDQSCWPRELVAAIHTASWYLNIRYDTWRGWKKARNQQTEAALGNIRFWSETFIMSPVCDLGKTIAEQAASPNAAPPHR